MADPPAMPDQPVGEQHPVGLGNELGDVRLDLDRVIARRPAEPAGQPPEVRVHRDAGDAERVAEHHVRGLAPNARQRDQLFELVGHPPAEALGQRGRQAHHRLRLGVEEPGGPQDLGHVLRVRRGEILGGRVLGEQHRRGQVHPLVRRLRGEHRGDKQLEGALEVQLAVRLRVRLRQHPVDLPCPPHQRRCASRGS